MVEGMLTFGGPYELDSFPGKASEGSDSAEVARDEPPIKIGEE